MFQMGETHAFENSYQTGEIIIAIIFGGFRV